MAAFWVVGYWVGDHTGHTLIEHWTGRRWVDVNSPDVAGTDNGSWWAIAVLPSTAWTADTFVDEFTFQ